MFSCECHQIGGRFIAEDPDCPAHGREAQREQEQADRDRQLMIDLCTSAVGTGSQQHMREALDTIRELLETR